MNNRAGKTVKNLSGEKAYYSFCPSPLPPVPGIEIDGEMQELFFALPCDRRGRMVGDVVTVHKGTVDEVHVWTRDVFRDAIVRGAVGLVAAHNHPSGDIRPSNEDRLLTARLVRAGRLLDIALVDHLVVNGAGDFASIRNTVFIGHRKLDFEEWG